MESHVNSFNFLDWKHYWHFSLGNLQRQVNYYLQFKSYLFKTDNTRYGRKRTIFWSNFVYFLGNLGTSLSILIYHFMADFEAKPFMSMVFTCIFRSVSTDGTPIYQWIGSILWLSKVPSGLLPPRRGPSALPRGYVVMCLCYVNITVTSLPLQLRPVTSYHHCPCV